MFSGNFRVLIFIDLLATALGGSLLLMMILSVSKEKPTPLQGTARDYIFYQVWADDPDACFKVIVKNGDNNNWLESPIQEKTDSLTGTFIINQKKEDVFAWGPVTEYRTDGTNTGNNKFNVYSPVEQSGNWTLGVLYYNNKKLNVGNIDVISSPVKVHHHIQTQNAVMDTTILVSLGNYSYIPYSVKVQSK